MVHLGKGALRYRLHLGLRSVHIGCNKSYVALRVQIIFRPPTLTLSDRPLYYFRTVHFDTFGPFTLSLSDRPLWHFRTVHFDTFGQSTLTLLDRPLWHLLTVQFDIFGPSSLTLSDRPLWLFSTVHFDTLTYPEGPSTFSRMTVYFDPWPSTLAQKTVHFGSNFLCFQSTTFPTFFQ